MRVEAMASLWQAVANGVDRGDEAKNAGSIHIHGGCGHL